MDTVANRDHMVRSFPDREYERAKELASRRGMNVGAYLALTVRLHEAALKKDHAGSSVARELLGSAGLDRVVENGK